MEIIQRQKKIIEDFSLFDNWSDKYSYLINLGKSLNEFPKEKKDHSKIIKGCQSQVWLNVNFNHGRLYFQGTSDSVIVSGLIGLLFKVYNDSTPKDIVNSTSDFINTIGLSKNLSVTRNNGFHTILSHIYNTAQYYNIPGV